MERKRPPHQVCGRARVFETSYGIQEQDMNTTKKLIIGAVALAAVVIGMVDSNGQQAVQSSYFDKLIGIGLVGGLLMKATSSSWCICEVQLMGPAEK